MTLMVVPVVGLLSVSESLVAMVTICVVYLMFRTLRTKVPEGLKKLPGPKPLPIIGNVLDVGHNPHLSLTAMGEQYGPVFQIHIGTRPIVVLCGNDTVRQALIKQGEEFAGRPDLYSFRFMSDGKSLAFSPDHAGVWRARRKLAMNALRSFSVVKSSSSYSCMLEEHICKEGECLVQELSTAMETKGSFDPFHHIVLSVTNVICGMCFGRRYGYDDQELLNLVNMSDEVGSILASGNPADFIPLLRFLPNQTMKAFLEVNDRFNSFVQKIVTEHYKSYDKNNIRDITDSLIDHCNDRKLDENSNVQVSDEKIVTIVNDLFGAGFDTISTVLSWAVLYLVTYPQIQEKLHQQLRENVGMDRTPSLADRPKLPLLEAFILELFRHTSFVPFTIPHCTTKDTALSGFFIPRDTCIFINQWQINHDPTMWNKPSTFSPERFLSSNSTEVNKLMAEKVLVFGLGKRRCIGENIGRAEVFLFLAILLQRLRFHELPGQTLDMTPEYGLTMKHKRCQLVARPRA
ncbi:cytochrome P450 1A1-like [Arapaima gigas]